MESDVAEDADPSSALWVTSWWWSRRRQWLIQPLVGSTPRPRCWTMNPRPGFGPDTTSTMALGLAAVLATVWPVWPCPPTGGRWSARPVGLGAAVSGGPHGLGVGWRDEDGTTTRFCLDPTVEQRAVLARHAGASRFAFNQCLRLVKTAPTDRRTVPDTDVPWGQTQHQTSPDPRTPKQRGRATNARRRDGSDQHSVCAGETSPKDAGTDVHTAPAA
jgi:Helix-turn-helix domain